MLLGEVGGGWELAALVSQSATIQTSPALSAYFTADPAGRLYQIGSVPVSHLATERYGRPDAGKRLLALSHDGQGGDFSAGAF